jgi:hypothetical protein
MGKAGGLSLKKTALNDFPSYHGEETLAAFLILLSL